MNISRINPAQLLKNRNKYQFNPLPEEIFQRGTPETSKKRNYNRKL